MCGFGGFWESNASGVDTIAQSIGQSLYHRGPDNFGKWYCERTGILLVHQRLSILDVSQAGSQPMCSSSGRYVIAYNGEVYNHLELRRRLELDGLVNGWSGHSDTETILACIAEWGIEKTLGSLVGMFAFALWDRELNCLTLARDRFGEKPLYWGWQNGALLFGSELKALKVQPAFRGDVDRNALTLFLRHNYIPAPHTIYKGVFKLSAGHYVTIRPADTADSISPQPYWSVNAAVEAGLQRPFTGSDSEATQLLLETLRESVNGQMLSDVPLGAFLSGGVDSSVVVSLMQELSSRPVKTFAIGFDDPRFNEAEHAASVARHLGTDHAELYVTANDALNVVPAIPSLYCEPFADSSQIPTYLVARLAREHVTVALSGDGGDELFGGYTPYLFAPRYWRLLSKIPRPVRGVLGTVMGELPLTEQLHKLAGVMGAPSREIFYQQVMSHWLTPESVVKGSLEPLSVLNSSGQWPKTDSYEQWMMAMESQMYMPDDILVKVDRAAMANSLETRVPLLDHRVAELAWRLPLHLKIRQGQGKWVLRQVLYQFVPKALIERPKKGFAVPMADWLRGPLRDWAENLLASERIEREGYFNVTPIRAVWQEHLSGKRNHSTRLWGILMFQAWLENERG